MDALETLAIVTTLVEGVALRLPFSPQEVFLVVGCPEAEQDHAEDERVFAHTFHVPKTVCVARAFENLKDGHKLGIMLHEFGHLYGGQEEGIADLWVDENLGIDLDYVNMVQWVEPRLLV